MLVFSFFDISNLSAVTWYAFALVQLLLQTKEKDLAFIRQSFLIEKMQGVRTQW